MIYGSIRTKPLEPGMKPCLHCKEGGRRAYTEFVRGWPNDADATWLTEPPKHAIHHWCDVGGPDSDWDEGQRYIHGHGALGGNIQVRYYDTKEAAIDAWNLHMTPVFYRPFNFVQRLMRHIKGAAL